MSSKHWLVFISKYSRFQDAGEMTFSTEVVFHILKRLRSSNALALTFLTAYKIDPWFYTIL